MIRAFVALRPSPAVCERIAELGEDLDCGRPVPFENVHVTLAFLGEHDRHVLEDAASEFDAIRAAPVRLGFEGVGIFGSRRPRSAHLHARPDPGLSALAESVRRACARAGIELERRKFRPHATVSRFPAGFEADEDLDRWLAVHAGAETASEDIDHFSLWRSELTRSGPVYTEAMRFALGDDALSRT